MKSIQRKYTKEIHNELGYWGTWLPSNKLCLGDVGVIKNGIFHFITSLENEEIPFRKISRSGFSSHEYASKGAVNIHSKFSGEASLPESNLKIDESGIIVNFNSVNAICFRIDKAKTSRIDNLHELEGEILRRCENGHWQKDWVLINELITAGNSIVLVSNGVNSKIEFQLNGELEKLGNVKLDAHHKVVYERNMAYKMLTEDETTPLFKVMGVSSKWFGEKRMIPKNTEFVKELEPDEPTILREIEPGNYD
jgi:hypothetical protein